MSDGICSLFLSVRSLSIFHGCSKCKEGMEMNEYFFVFFPFLRLDSALLLLLLLLQRNIWYNLNEWILLLNDLRFCTCMHRKIENNEFSTRSSLISTFVELFSLYPFFVSVKLIDVQCSLYYWIYTERVDSTVVARAKQCVLCTTVWAEINEFHFAVDFHLELRPFGKVEISRERWIKKMMNILSPLE